MRLALVTTANHWPDDSIPYYWHKAMLASLKKFGMTPTILGAQCSWLGLMTKPRLLKEYLDKNWQQIDCLIVFDAFDIVWARNPREIVDEWHDMGRPFIIGGEKAIFPPEFSEKQFPECASPYRFPNSGFIICTAQDMRTVLDAMQIDKVVNEEVMPDGSVHHGNDQREYIKMFLQQPVPMRIDTETRFVWNLCDCKPDEFDWSGPIPRNVNTGNCPATFHGNGDGKRESVMQPIVDHLGLSNK